MIHFYRTCRSFVKVRLETWNVSLLSNHQTRKNVTSLMNWCIYWGLDTTSGSGQQQSLKSNSKLFFLVLFPSSRLCRKFKKSSAGLRGPCRLVLFPWRNVSLFLPEHVNRRQKNTKIGPAEPNESIRAGKVTSSMLTWHFHSLESDLDYCGDLFQSRPAWLKAANVQNVHRLILFPFKSKCEASV